jgi:outer membrane protein OmpA-like peptidoglycan-associated protein
MNRLVTMLFIIAGFTLSAFAQQTTSNSGLQPAGQTASASQSAPRTDFWDGDEPGLGALLFHPFASKEYVRRHVQSIRDRVEELDALTASSRKEIDDVDARSQQGIKLASEKTNLADQHATEAANKAQAAQQMATAVDARLSAVETQVRGMDQYKSAPQTEIRFRPGQTVLSKQAKNALDEMAGQLKNQRGYILEVQGFSSGHGQAAIANSRKMADSVVRYMVLNHDIPSYRIYAIGMGDASPKGTSGTRVEVSLLKNELAQAAK